ncbi:hypothetical protein ACWPM1_00005, partial [Tsuneonella sp. HG249]
FMVEKEVSFNDGTTWDTADNPDGPEASVMDAPKFRITVTNMGNVTLTGYTIADVNYTFNTVNGVPIDLTGVTISESLSANGELDVGETWTLIYDQPLDVGYHKNTVTVDFTETGPQTDDAYYYVLANDGPGVRTPGFWQNLNNGGKFWDGIAGNEKQGDTFPDGNPNVDGNQDLLYAVDSNNDGVINGSDQKGLLIGDYNRDGFTGDNPNTVEIEGAEDTLFISYVDALKVVGNEAKGGNDGIYTIGRDVVATWLNYLGGNNIDPTSSDPDNIANAPKHYIDDAINWLQEFASSADNDVAPFARFQFDAAVKSSSAFWKNASGNQGGHTWNTHHSGAEIHNALGGYNENGIIDGMEYAGDGDSALLKAALADYQQDQASLLQFQSAFVETPDSLPAEVMMFAQTLVPT